MTVERFIVTEIEGFLSLSARLSGLTCHILDTETCYQVVFAARTEDRSSRVKSPTRTYSPASYADRCVLVREAARSRAAELNDAVPR